MLYPHLNGSTAKLPASHSQTRNAAEHNEGFWNVCSERKPVYDQQILSVGTHHWHGITGLPSWCYTLNHAVVFVVWTGSFHPPHLSLPHTRRDGKPWGSEKQNTSQTDLEFNTLNSQLKPTVFFCKSVQKNGAWNIYSFLFPEKDCNSWGGWIILDQIWSQCWKLVGIKPILHFKKLPQVTLPYHHGW